MTLHTAFGVDLDTVLDEIETRPDQDVKDGFNEVRESWGSERIATVVSGLVGAQITVAEFTRRFIAHYPARDRKDPTFLNAVETAALASECLRRAISNKELFSFCFPAKPKGKRQRQQIRYGWITAQSAAIEKIINPPGKFILDQMNDMGHKAAIVVWPDKVEGSIGTGIILSSGSFDELREITAGLIDIQSQLPGAGPC